MFQEVFLIVWLSSGAIHMNGLTNGSLGRSSGADDDQARACAQFDELKKMGIDAHLYVVNQGVGGCDWGCEYPVTTAEILCETYEVPAQKKTLLRRVSK